ncbi:hypothetical protein BaRGS_00016097 [Batillaria attramentaria]|uniref:Uncharacterized protein n=1 Tax=Batillaria attramentaria TaxID=370345 RepID=A0ABD0L082_9CAEN
MSGRLGVKAAAIVVGAFSALAGYTFLVKPYVDKRNMDRIEQEAKQLYQLRQRRLESQGSEPQSQQTGTR